MKNKNLMVISAAVMVILAACIMLFVVLRPLFAGDETLAPTPTVKPGESPTA